MCPCLALVSVCVCMHLHIRLHACVCVYLCEEMGRKAGWMSYSPRLHPFPVPVVLDTQGMELGAGVGSLEGWVPETRVWTHRWLLQAPTHPARSTRGHSLYMLPTERPSPLSSPGALMGTW